MLEIEDANRRNAVLLTLGGIERGGVPGNRAAMLIRARPHRI